MKTFLKINFNSGEQYLIFFLIFSYFLPPFYLSFRFEHIILYSTSIYFFFKRAFDKKYYNFLLKNKYIAIFIALNLLVILGLLISTFRSLTVINSSNPSINLKNFLSFLSVMDNFIQPVLLIFISTFFLISAEKKKNIRCILFLLISFSAVNVLYALFEYIVILEDKYCVISVHLKKTASCDFIALIDSIYNAGLYSDVLPEYIEKIKTDINFTKLNASDKLAAVESFYYINSNSIGWIALVNAERLSGVFNMPIQTATIHGACIFLTILFLKNEQDILKKNKLLKIYIHIIFLLNVIGAIIPASKVTFYLTVPALIIFLFLFRNEINFFFKKKLFIYFLIFIMINSFLIANRWNGYNLYWSQIAKLIQTVSGLTTLNNFSLPEQIIFNRSSNYSDIKLNKYESYDQTKKRFEEEIHKNNANKIFLINKFRFEKDYKLDHSRSKQIDDLLKTFGQINMNQFNNLTEKNSKLGFGEAKNNFSFLIHYFTSGRLGIEPIEIILLKNVSPIFGFGPIFHINYDNFYYYTLFNGGYFSLSFFILGLIIIIYSIFKNKNFSKEKFFTVSYLMVFLIFLVSSLGAPSYLLNTAVIFFYLPTAIILFKK